MQSAIMTTKQWILAMLFAGAVTLAQAQVNMITNGSFEANTPYGNPDRTYGAISGWAYTGDSPAGAGSLYGHTPTDGNYLSLIGGPASWGAGRYTANDSLFFLTAGQEYTFSFDVLGHGAFDAGWGALPWEPGKMGLYYFVGGDEHGTLAEGVVYPDVDAWTSKSVTFTATQSGPAAVSVYLYNNIWDGGWAANVANVYLTVDNFQLNPVPEPANMITNGSFEANTPYGNPDRTYGAISGWTYTGDSPAGAGSLYGRTPTDGNYLSLIGGPASWSAGRYTANDSLFSLTAGQEYTLSFDVLGHGAFDAAWNLLPWEPGKMGLYYFVGGDAHGVLAEGAVYPNVDAWTSKSVTFTATQSGPAAVSVYLYNNIWVGGWAANVANVYLAVDNFQLNPVPPEPASLALAGATPYVITLAESASAPEKTAAAELAAYLKQVTGAEFAIVAPSAAAGRPVLAVGPDAAKALAPDLDLSKAGAKGLGEDGIVIKTVPPHLVLTGAEGSKRGTLYAVYEFLEREVGVRWWTPTAETVPRRPTLVVAPASTRYVPPFGYRETLGPAIRPYVWETTDEVPRFAVRMRQNGHFPKIPAAWGGHYTLLGWCHTFFGHEGLMPPEKYFADHPEWYSEINGQRKWQDAQLCLTNEAMLAELTRNVLERIRKNPEAGMISVAQNDVDGGNCQCAACKAIDDAEGSPAGSLLFGINRVAEGVEKEFPGFFVETLAYLHTRKPPKTIRPRHNVILRYSVIERSAVQPITAQINHQLAEDLQGWSALKPNLYLWDYTANLEHPFTPEPRAFVFGPDLRLYRRMGAVSFYCEHNHGYSPLSDFDELHTWLLSKLLWNPDQDDRALIREFLDGYYGPAGKDLYAYQQLLADRVDTNFVSSWASPRSAQWLALDTMNRATELFDAAAAAVADDPVLTARVRRARIALDHQWLCGSAGYRYVSERERKPYRGPADMDVLLADLTTRCREADVQRVGFVFGQASLEDYLLSSRRAGERVPVRFLQEADETYNSFRNGIPMPLPPELAGVPRERVVDVQEDRMDLFYEATPVFDEQAVNHAAAFMDPGTTQTWAVQVRNLAAKGVVPGRWHAYAVIRVDALAETGVAFTAGVYDSSGVYDVSRLVGMAITDGRYRLYDFGAHDFSDAFYLWVGTTGGVDPKNVKGIYVDRFIFVREP